MSIVLAESILRDIKKEQAALSKSLERIASKHYYTTDALRRMRKRMRKLSNLVLMVEEEVSFSEWKVKTPA